MSRITRPSSRLALLSTAVALAAPGSAAAVPTLVKVGDFNAPTNVAAPPRDTSRVFVVERAGVIKVVRNGSTLATPFLDIRAAVATDGERGLLSTTFAPDYATSGLFYVYLTASDSISPGELQVREYHRSAADPDRADPAGRIVWRQAHDQASNHNGGQVEFGPDGRLWLATGDGGGANDQFGHAQDLKSQLGKLLRIDPRPGDAGSYSIPADNPYAGRTDVAPAIWAAGLRNPFRFSFDRGSGDLVLGDVGQGAREEIDYVRPADELGRGGNFGWPCFEGSTAGPRSCTPGGRYLPPVFEYSQGSPRAVTGGYVVRDPGLPTLKGRYVFADTYAGNVRSLVLNTPLATDDRSAGLPIRTLLVSFGEDACGHIYVVSLNGTVERIQDGAPGACVLKPDIAPPAGPPAAPAPPPQPVDRTAPVLRVSAARRQRLGGVVAVRVSVSCNEACRVAAGGQIRGVTTLRPRQAQLPAGRRVVVRLRPTKKGAKLMLRSLRRRRTLLVRLSIRATDPAGNLGRAQLSVRLRR